MAQSTNKHSVEKIDRMDISWAGPIRRGEDVGPDCIWFMLSCISWGARPWQFSPLPLLGDCFKLFWWFATF
jgi:hypothetical protein